MAYAKLVEASGAALIAVHGRTREQKNAGLVRANWDAIKVRSCLAAVSLFTLLQWSRLKLQGAPRKPLPGLQGLCQPWLLSDAARRKHSLPTRCHHHWIHGPPPGFASDAVMGLPAAQVL